MASDIKYAVTLQNAMLNHVTAEVDGGGGAGSLIVYDGTAPADADTGITTQNALAILPLSATSFGAAAAGVITANAITSEDAAPAAGTASFFRLIDSAGTCHVQGTAGVGTSFDLNLSTTTIGLSDIVSCSSFTITEGNP